MEEQNKNKLTTLDTPADLKLTDLERKIVMALASRKSTNDISLDYGIPKSAVVNLMRKPGVSDFVQELVDARNQMMKLYLPDLLMGILEDKVMANQEDEEKRLADITKKDPVDIAKQLSEMLKTTGSESKEAADNPFLKLYQQINYIQNGGKE